MKILFCLLLTSRLFAADANSKSNKFPIVYDQDGDAIITLDAKLRKKINTTKMIEASHLYDNEYELKNFREEYAKNILTGSKKKYGTYTAQENDDFKKISVKLYGTPSRWAELQVLNENKLKSDNIEPGMKLKYVLPNEE